MQKQSMEVDDLKEQIKTLQEQMKVVGGLQEQIEVLNDALRHTTVHPSRRTKDI